MDEDAVSDWTPEAIATEEARRQELVNKGICPDSGGRLVKDHPLSDAPLGRLSCKMCDCFGYPPDSTDSAGNGG